MPGQTNGLHEEKARMARWAMLVAISATYLAHLSFRPV
jgi:hypothetical protein